MLVLQHLGLDPGRDHISVVETTGGALGQMRALENGEIDATVLDPSLSAQLIAKGLNLLMDLSSIDMPSWESSVETPWVCAWMVIAFSKEGSDIGGIPIDRGTLLFSCCC